MTGSRNPNFDRVASIYDFSKGLLLCGAIQRCQYHHLPLLKNSKKILVIGGGTGKIISRIHQQCEFEELTFVDSSASMIEQAITHIQDYDPGLEQKIQFQNADILTGFEASGFDAVVAPFVFDCFTDESLGAIGENLRKWLKPNGLLLFSDFHESQKSNLSRILSRLITRPLYFLLDLTCDLNIKHLPDFDLMFNNLPLIKIEENLSFTGVLRSAVFRLDQ